MRPPRISKRSRNVAPLSSSKLNYDGHRSEAAKMRQPLGLGASGRPDEPETRRGGDRLPSDEAALTLSGRGDAPHHGGRSARLSRPPGRLQFGLPEPTSAASTNAGNTLRCGQASLIPGKTRDSSPPGPFLTLPNSRSNRALLPGRHRTETAPSRLPCRIS
jgi:hypothetical protein